MVRTPALKKRRVTLKKKAEELSTLCGIDVAYICFDRNGSLDTWPEDRNKVRDIVLKYMEVKSGEPSSSGAAASSSSSLEAIIKNEDSDGETQEEVVGELGNWGWRLDELSEDQLGRLYEFVEEKLERVTARIANLEEKGGNRGRRRRINLDLETLKVQVSVDSPPKNLEAEGSGDRLSSSSSGGGEADRSFSSLLTGITRESL